MRNVRRLMFVSFVSFGGLPDFLIAQGAIRPADLRGTWELISSRDLKTGVTTPRNGIEWMQFTRSHWTVVSMDNGRPVVSPARYDSLSAEEKAKVDYARVFDGKGGQVFAARGGTWKLDGDKLHQTAVMAIYAPIVGVDRILKVRRWTGRTLVVQTPFVGSPELMVELTYRRID